MQSEAALCLYEVSRSLSSLKEGNTKTEAILCLGDFFRYGLNGLRFFLFLNLLNVEL